MENDHNKIPNIFHLILSHYLRFLGILGQYIFVGLQDWLAI